MLVTNCVLKLKTEIVMLAVHGLISRHFFLYTGPAINQPMGLNQLSQLRLMPAQVKLSVRPSAQTTQSLSKNTVYTVDYIVLEKSGTTVHIEDEI
jgi:hypothetical protein